MVNAGYGKKSKTFESVAGDQKAPITIEMDWLDNEQWDYSLYFTVTSEDFNHKFSSLYSSWDNNGVTIRWNDRLLIDSEVAYHKATNYEDSADNFTNINQEKLDILKELLATLLVRIGFEPTDAGVAKLADSIHPNVKPTILFFGTA